MNRDDRPFRPGWHAAADPDRVAVVLEPTGETLTYGELEDRSARLANAFRSMGLAPGDHIAIMSSNDIDYPVAVWAAQRSGLYYTPVNPQLSVVEAEYIVNDCEAKVFLLGNAAGGNDFAAVADSPTSRTPKVTHRITLGAAINGYRALDDVIAEHGPIPTRPEVEGSLMGYTSGTTGRPKGVLRPLTATPVGTADPIAYLADMVGFDRASRYLVTAGLYHAAPCAWTMSGIRRGATVVMLRRFDAELTLRIIHDRQITHGLFVPTMLIRMLKLSDRTRAEHDISSIKSALHVGAPCPPDVKRAMIDWWGPVIDEFYAGTEATGATFIRAPEWLGHPGSVGRAVRGVVHITDDDGTELGPGETGWVWFESSAVFEYFGDPDKTAEAHDHRGWSKLGDLGHVDDGGYLFLTDRASFMVISGGMNIYPQEVENVLALHPKVADVAVFGIPHDELGEVVAAVVQPEKGVAPTPELATEVIAYCRDHLARYKCPRTVEFIDVMPRQESGKLAKADLRRGYLATLPQS